MWCEVARAQLVTRGLSSGGSRILTYRGDETSLKYALKHGGRSDSDPDPPFPPSWEVQSVEEVWSTFGPNLALKAPKLFFWHTLCVYAQNTENFMGNHLEERLLDQAQARASYTPLFWGHSRSIPQGMILDVQPLVKSLFCPIRPSPNVFFDFQASTP